MRSQVARKSENTYHHGDLRDALLQAAERELAEKGFEAFSLRGCAKRAGVSHAAPAHHFPTADDLLTALAGRGFERLVVAMRQHEARASSSPAARLTAIGLGYIDFAEENPALFKLMFGSDRPAHDDRSLQERGGEAFAVLVEALTALRGETPLSSRAGTEHLSAAWAIVHGLAHLLIERRLPFLNDLLDDHREAVLGAIIARTLLGG
jgi:AcrR family transcriptional regulator